MRTTLTLDKDVAARLGQPQRDRGATFKEIVNDAIRQGLRQMSRKPRAQKRYRRPTVSLGRCFVGSLDDVAEVLAVAGGSFL